DRRDRRGIRPPFGERVDAVGLQRAVVAPADVPRARHRFPEILVVAQVCDPVAQPRVDPLGVCNELVAELRRHRASSIARSRYAATGSFLPLTLTAPSGSTWARSSSSSRVASPITIPPGGASASRRDARFTVSPIAVNDRTSSPPMLPISAGPLLMPMRTFGQSACSAAARAIVRATLSAARAAAHAWSGWRIGALNST